MQTKWWHKWRKLDRVVPFATMIAVLVAIILSLLQVIKFSFFENLTLTLLGLISFDAFIERMGILERILRGVERPQHIGPSLMSEEKLLNQYPFEEFIHGAEEVFIFGGSLAGLFKREYDAIVDWLALKENEKKKNSKTNNANLKILLVDPKLVKKGKITVQSLFRNFGMDEAHARTAYAKDVEETLMVISELQKSFPNRIDVRLTKETPSITIMMVDQRRARISINLYQNDLKKRPIFEIHKDVNHEWYSTFENLYYKQVWDLSRRYESQL